VEKLERKCEREREREGEKRRENVREKEEGPPDGSANLFYTELASPFDSLGYHRHKSNFLS